MKKQNSEETEKWQNKRMKKQQWRNSKRQNKWTKKQNSVYFSISLSLTFFISLSTVAFLMARIRFESFSYKQHQTYTYYFNYCPNFTSLKKFNTPEILILLHHIHLANSTRNF